MAGKQYGINLSCDDRARDFTKDCERLRAPTRTETVDLETKVCFAEGQRTFVSQVAGFLVIILFVLLPSSVYAQVETQAVVQQESTAPGVEQKVEGDFTSSEISDFIQGGPDQWTSREGLASSIKIMLMLTVLTLAPAILLMTTCFIRIIVVLGLLRQAIGTNQLPPSQVISSLALFMTFLVMTPVWNEVRTEAIVPYTAEDSSMTWDEAWDRGVSPIKRFMSHQIYVADNEDDVWMFFQYLPQEEQNDVPEDYSEVPLKVLLPAFMISELKVAFLIGFNIYLPFLILDIVVSSVTISMGMMMLPPVMISLPFKLMLFVLVDGWNLVIQMLIESCLGYT